MTVSCLSRSLALIALALFFFWSRRITAKVYQVRQIVLYFLWQKKFLGQVLLGFRFPCSVCGDACITTSFNNHHKAIHEA
jgi:hypothetical protein